MPRLARRTRPCCRIWVSTCWAVLEATEKQMPCAPMMTAVLTPITSARELTSGPPELPGLSAASVWMRSPMRRPVRSLGAQHGDVGIRVAAEHAGRDLAGIGERKVDRRGVFDDVVVGQHE